MAYKIAGIDACRLLLCSRQHGARVAVHGLQSNHELAANSSNRPSDQTANTCSANSVFPRNLRQRHPRTTVKDDLLTVDIQRTAPFCIQ